MSGTFARRGASAEARLYSILYALQSERVERILVNYPEVRSKMESIAKRQAQQRSAAAVHNRWSGGHRAVRSDGQPSFPFTRACG